MAGTFHIKMLIFYLIFYLLSHRETSKNAPLEIEKNTVNSITHSAICCEYYYKLSCSYIFFNTGSPVLVTIIGTGNGH